MAEQSLADLRLTLFSDPESLQDPELLALVMGTADRRRSSLENAQRLLEKTGGFGEMLAGARGPAFLKNHGLGQTPGGRLAALAEIVRRLGESGGRAGSRAQALALAYLSTAAETLEAMAEQPRPTAAQVRKTAQLMRQWYSFAAGML